MAQDDDFTIGGRKTRKSGSQGSPRPSTSKGGGGNQSAIKLGSLSGGSMSFTKRLAKDMAIAKRSSGRRTYAKPSKPKTGRFNARGRGRTALAAGIGPNRSWQTFDGSSIRYRMQEAGMVPSVVEDTIANGIATAGTGARAGTTKFETGQAMAVTDDATGRVITTDPLKGRR